VWLRENVCMCPYVCCGRRAMWRRCACHRDIERCKCANDHAWVGQRHMPKHCVYMREQSSICTCVCVCEIERSIYNTTTISPNSSVPRTIACNTCINAHILTPSPGPCPPQCPHIALYLARTISSWKPYLACSFPSHTNTFLSIGLSSLNTWHTHIHSPSPEHIIHPHPRLYGDHSRLCFSAPQHAQHLNL